MSRSVRHAEGFFKTKRMLGQMASPFIIEQHFYWFACRVHRGVEVEGITNWRQDRAARALQWFSAEQVLPSYKTWSSRAGLYL